MTLAINTATDLKTVGMCHEFAGGVSRVARVLRVPKHKIAAKASGINHFTFFTEIRDKKAARISTHACARCGQRRFFDFPPAVTAAAKQLAKIPLVELAVDQYTRRSSPTCSASTDSCPARSDSHIGEYVPFAKEKASVAPRPGLLHQALMARLERTSTSTGTASRIPPMHRTGRSAEEPFRLIESMWTDSARTLNAVNVPNEGYVPNLPDGAIVEVPADRRTRTGSRPESMPPIHEPLAEFMRTQIELQDLVVKAALTGDPEPAFEAVRRDPLSPPDDSSCRAMFDELASSRRAHCPSDRPPAASSSPPVIHRKGRAMASFVLVPGGGHGG